MAGWLKLLHVAVATGFIVGLVGRTIAFRFARRATALPGVEALLELSDWFDTRLVIPGSLLVLFSGSWAAIQGRWGLLTASAAGPRGCSCRSRWWRSRFRSFPRF